MTFLLPTLTYTTFTLKTFKGQFTTKVRTCSLKYLPTHLLKDCNYVLFSKRIFSIKLDVGITRTLKRQEITFMYKKQPFRKRLNKKIYVINHNKNKLLYMPFTTKQNKKLKFKGVWKQYDT